MRSSISLNNMAGLRDVAIGQGQYGWMIIACGVKFSMFVHGLTCSLTCIEGSGESGRKKKHHLEGFNDS